MGRKVVFMVAFLSLVGSFAHGSRASSTVAPPTPHEVIKLPDNASTLPILHKPPSRNWVRSPAPVPAHLISFHKHHARTKPSSRLAPAPDLISQVSCKEKIQRPCICTLSFVSSAFLPTRPFSFSHPISPFSKNWTGSNCTFIISYSSIPPIRRR